MTALLRRVGAKVKTGVFDQAVRTRRSLIVAAHIGLFALSYLLAFGLRFDFQFPAEEVDRIIITLPFLLAARAAAFWIFHLYKGLWRYVSVKDVIDLAKAVTASSVVFAAAALLLGGPGYPRSVVVLDLLLCLGLTGGLRIGTRLLLERRMSSSNGHGERKRAIVVGVGDMAEALLREIGRGTLPYVVVGLAGDDPSLHGRRIHGVTVLGAIDDLAKWCHRHRAKAVLLATEGTTAVEKRRILTLLKDTEVEVRAVPTMTDLLMGRAFIGELQKVKSEDLLGRSAIGTNIEQLRENLAGRRVLVTGAAGSIGSELARQIASFEPEVLVMFDRAESDLYLTSVELRERFDNVKIEAVVGDILDVDRVNQVMSDYSPQLVYHAAAYKHVPLMENHPLEGIKNNVFGTEIVARAAVDNGVGEFVLISTDKAVRPVGVMGMTKRVAELVIRSYAGLGTTFVAVRFGNVLGSNGSVLPLFHKQISSGSPVTVTDPDALRYFMMTSEAVELVLQAGALGRDGELYFLHTGEPIRIGDLAENFIRMSGLEPGLEVPIKVTGLRPGERLIEEMVIETEDVVPGPHEKIHVVRQSPFDEDAFRIELECLRLSMEKGKAQAAVEKLKGVACEGVFHSRSAG